MTINNKNFIKTSSKNMMKISKYFQDALSLIDVNLESSQYQLFNEAIIKMEDIVFVLSNMIIIKEEENNFELQRSLINEAIWICKKESINDVTDFLGKINTLFNIRKRLPKIHYHVVASLHINPSYLPKRKGKFLDHEFTTYNSNTFYKKYKFRQYLNPSFQKIKSGFNNFILLSTNEMNKIDEPYYVEFKVDAINENEAMKKGWRFIEAFRGIINYSLSIGSLKLMGGLDTPYSKILPSTFIFVFDAKKLFLNHWYTRSLYEKKNATLNSNDIKKLDYSFNKIMNAINKIKNNQIKEFLINAFIRHIKGLDEVAYGTSIVCFWQTLELVSLKHLYMFSEKEVCRRIKSLFEKEISKDKIETLYSRRNFIVHEGLISNYDLKDINNAKLISERVIIFLINNLVKFSTMSELNYFYKYKSINNHNIKEIKKIFMLIQKERK